MAGLYSGILLNIYIEITENDDNGSNNNNGTMVDNNYV